MAARRSRPAEVRSGQLTGEPPADDQRWGELAWLRAPADTGMDK
jgi:hypothetical protein